MRLKEAIDKYKKVTPSLEHPYYIELLDGDYTAREKYRNVHQTGYQQELHIDFTTIIESENKEKWIEYKPNFNEEIAGMLCIAYDAGCQDDYDNKELETELKAIHNRLQKELPADIIFNTVSVDTVSKAQEEFKSRSSKQARILAMLCDLRDESNYVFTPVKGSFPIDERLKEFSRYLQSQVSQIMDEIGDMKESQYVTG